MAVYQPTIGLEIHVELKTQTKMFCCSKNDADETRPNVNICPVCMAHPGTLPVINAEAVRHVLRVGVALGSKLADYTEFDRKNYFYPDLPKGYQLSQYEFPLVEGGALRDVAITRVHLEEDTASSMHLPAQAGDEATDSTGSPQAGATTIDYNRAGVPLMELVTEPVITSAEQAGEFARELQLLFRYLGVSEANMEKGEMRVEANISMGEKGERGVKVEIKNLNSFRAMERAVEYEIKRQTELLERGEVVVQETRGWDESKQATFAQRTKEGSADYRYFPDPDLPSLRLSEIQGFDAGSLRATQPELPSERRNRYLAAGVKADDAELYVRETVFGDFFDAVSEGMPQATALLASNYIANDLVNIVSSFAPPSPKATEGKRDMQNRDADSGPLIPISVQSFREVIAMIEAKEISSRSAKDLLVICTTEAGTPREIAKNKGLLSSKDPAMMGAAVDKVIADNPTVVADYKAGKAAALEFLVGQGMKVLKGSGDPVEVRRILTDKLS
ncbi:MAG: Asp-tRNA(Asn)/Glu-tRNA(Gln) amidotransferase subunit GatB [Patescibacteria group bacterium]